MDDAQLLALLTRIDPQTKRIPPGLRALADAIEASFADRLEAAEAALPDAERYRWLRDMRELQVLQAAYSVRAACAFTVGQCDAAVDAARFGVPPPVPREPQTDEEIAAAIALRERTGRCYACGWALKATIDEGCVAGNCSYRPTPETPGYEQWHKRATDMGRLRTAMTGAGSGE